MRDHFAEADKALAEAARVKKNIGEIVLQFLRERQLEKRTTFYVRELHDYVAHDAEIAPASADRILRMLRRDKKCDYRVVNRHDSLYEVLST